MNEILTQYLFFLLKTITIVIALVVILGQIAAMKKSQANSSNIKVKKINDLFDETKDKVARHIFAKDEYKKLTKANKSKQKKQRNLRSQNYLSLSSRVILELAQLMNLETKFRPYYQ